MLYLAWDREINISLFFCDVFVWKWGPRPRTSSRCYYGNNNSATLKKGIFFCSPLECLTACKIWRGVENFHFLSCLILTDLFLTINTRIFVGPNVACHPVNNAIKSCEELWNKPETILEFFLLFRFIMDYTSVGYKIASLKRVM